ncbi:MAG: hypothetical protein JW922_09940 [Paludibacteraceae bacterium]|nr:hypothetical protein [Paludibacteraceae bacterium]
MEFLEAEEERVFDRFTGHFEASGLTEDELRTLKINGFFSIDPIPGSHFINTTLNVNNNEGETLFLSLTDLTNDDLPPTFTMGIEPPISQRRESGITKRFTQHSLYKGNPRAQEELEMFVNNVRNKFLQ